MPSNLLLFGAPGSGKGSVSECLVRDYGLVHVSAGNLLRMEVERNTQVGRNVAALMNEGKLIPDEVIVRIVVDRINQPDAKEKGTLLDGFPRTLSQAQALTATGFHIDAMVFLCVDAHRLEERCLQRRLDPITGRIYNLKSDPPPPEIASRLLIRSDDTREKHQQRMKIYRKQKSDLMKYYEGKVIKIDGNPPSPVVYASLRSAFDALLKGKLESKL